MICAICSALNLPGEPLRSPSDNTSMISSSSFSSVVSSDRSASASRALASRQRCRQRRTL
jgi:hypothetical protein